MSGEGGAAIVHDAREMGGSHAEFHRSIPVALAGFEWTGAGSPAITARDGERVLRIRLAPERRRRIASLSVPVTDVSFEFRGFTTVEVEAFMARFRRAFQRGGG